MPDPDEEQDAKDAEAEEREELVDEAKKHAEGLAESLKDLEDHSIMSDDMNDREKFERLQETTKEIKRELDE